jgi:hypothetical protein
MALMYKFWVPWVCLPLCCELKVVQVNVYLLHRCTYFCFLNISQFVELDESMLDGLGILPQRKQQKKLLLVSCICNFDHFKIWILDCWLFLPMVNTVNQVEFLPMDRNKYDMIVDMKFFKEIKFGYVRTWFI